MVSLRRRRPTRSDDGLKKIVSAFPEKGIVGLSFNEEYGGAFGDAQPVYDKAGGLVHRYFLDATADLIEWYRKCFAAGLMSKEFSVMKDSQLEDLFKAGRLVMYWRNLYHNYTYEKAMQKVDPTAKAWIMPYFKGPKGYASRLGLGYAGGLVISKKVPEAKVRSILDLYNRTASEEITDLFFNGIENVHYKVANGQRVATELASKELNNAILQIFANKNQDWSKIDNINAPKEYNEARRKAAQKQLEIETVTDPFRVIDSDTWIKEWPEAVARVRVDAHQGHHGRDQHGRVQALPELDERATRR